MKCPGESITNIEDFVDQVDVDSSDVNKEDLFNPGGVDLEGDASFTLTVPSDFNNGTFGALMDMSLEHENVVSLNVTLTYEDGTTQEIEVSFLLPSFAS